MNNNFNRRRFLQTAFASSLVYGTGLSSQLITPAHANIPAGLDNLLINLNLSGGPDLRHLLVPAYDANDDSFGGKYWKHRTRSQKLSETGVTAQQRYENDYVEFTVNNANWNGAGLVDATGVNSGVKFGIWKEAGWLIDMFSNGNVALIFNAVGGTNRAHDLSSLMLDQGNVLASLNQRGASGWGGRLARSALGNSISLTNSPRAFCFGPTGAAPNYNPRISDNRDLLSINNSRSVGLYDFNIEDDQLTRQNQKMARASKSYYAAIRKEQIGRAYQKALDHEKTIRNFGDMVGGILNDDVTPIPTLIRALRDSVDGINIDPNDPENNGRRVLRSSGFGTQIRNIYDMMVIHNISGISPRVMSLDYGGWDSHGDQRRIPAQLASDPNFTGASRGIESGLRDIFGGQFGSNPGDPNALHCGFSALWESIPNASDRNKMVVTIAGEFGRQIRDNEDSGTDHGKGNLMFVIGEQVRGGVYGEIFQDEEVDKYDNTSLRTPDIDPLTEIDTFFSKVCDWVHPNSGSAVFPRTAAGYSGEPPLIEQLGMFNNLMT